MRLNFMDQVVQTLENEIETYVRRTSRRDRKDWTTPDPQAIEDRAPFALRYGLLCLFRAIEELPLSMYGDNLRGYLVDFVNHLDQARIDIDRMYRRQLRERDQTIKTLEDRVALLSDRLEDLDLDSPDEFNRGGVDEEN